MEKRLEFNKFRHCLSAALATKGLRAIIKFRHGKGSVKIEVQLDKQINVETGFVYECMEPFLEERGYFFDEDSPHDPDVCRDYRNKKEKRLMVVIISNHSGCGQKLIQITCTIHENIDG